MKMLKPLLLSALISIGGAALAAGADYTAALKTVDTAMAKAAPGSTDEARRLRAEAEKMMKEGKEREAMQLLEKAKQVLGVR